MTKTAKKNEFIGTCQVCFKNQVVDSDRKLVLHGYSRPGDGAIRGNCEGWGELAYELSCEKTKEVKAREERYLVDLEARLAKLNADQVETLLIEVDNPNYRYGSRETPKYLVKEHRP